MGLKYNSVWDFKCMHCTFVLEGPSNSPWFTMIRVAAEKSSEPSMFLANFISLKIAVPMHMMLTSESHFSTSGLIR